MRSEDHQEIQRGVFDDLIEDRRELGSPEVRGLSTDPDDDQER